MFLVVAVGGMFAHKHFGLTLTTDGLQVASPLGRPPEVATGSGSFAFMATQRGSDRPVAYDPCRPVEYVVNDAMAPPGAGPLLLDAIEQISAATGLVFVSAGNTDAIPRKDLSLLAPRREPVLIAWTDPSVVKDLAGPTAGIGGSTPRQDDYAGELEFLTGMVALDSHQLAPLMTDPAGPEQVRAIIVHELGHLVGLAHVVDPRELMHSANVGLVDLGPGDREGLAHLGSGRCFH